MERIDFMVGMLVLLPMLSRSRGFSLRRCNLPVTDKPQAIKSFKSEKYLKVEWKDDTEVLNLSFSGNENDSGTRFVTRTMTSGMPRAYSLEGKPHYFLAVENGKLFLRKHVNCTMDSKYLFRTRRVWVTHNANGQEEKEQTKILTSLYSNGTTSDAATKIKSNKSGAISLGRNWRDCRAWLIFEEKDAS